MSRYDLTDSEWRVIEPLLPNKPRGVPRVDDRRVLNGIFWVLRSGARILVIGILAAVGRASSSICPGTRVTLTSAVIVVCAILVLVYGLVREHGNSNDRHVE
jgi:transposase